jgi:hypothetical protein
MKLRRTALVAAIVLAASAAAVSAAVVPSMSAGAAKERLELVCLVTARTEQTVQRPSHVVDQLIADTRSYRGPCAEYGERARLGNGEVIAYSQRVGPRPVAVGMILTDGVLTGLPLNPANDNKWCFDKDGNGTVDRNTECSGGYERQLDLSRDFQRRADTPLTYVLNNWNPHGHIPVGVYNVPHFDVHFYTGTDAERTAIRPGPCPALVNCDDYELGKRLPAAKYLAPDYIDVDALEPAMGNHLVDPTAPEFNGTPFTHTFLYGVWNTKVTFYEPMVTHEYFSGLRAGTINDACFDFKLPTNFQESGWYPTKYCLRHRDNRSDMTISLENFVHRDAT